MSDLLTPSPRSKEDEACHACGQFTLHHVPGFSTFRRVTSDCRPWPAGGRLCICQTCGCVQKPADAAFERESADIYSGYAIYHQSGGAEQAVFDASGQAATRSSRLVAALRSQVSLPARGRLLDVGCGNGATLRAFSEAEPAWSLTGTERNDSHRRQIEAIPGVESLHTCDLQDIPGRFDVVTMVHVLEHVPRPTTFLAAARSKLSADGVLVVEVPDTARNPFDLLIADHCTHFTAATAALVLYRALCPAVLVAEDWVPKELTLVARPAMTRTSLPPPLSPSSSRKRVERDLGWLSRLRESARQLAQRRAFGLFGTSIAAAWLFGELEGAVSFFVDEDPNRVGKTFLDRPIYHPSKVAAGSHVLLALPGPMATAIHPRIARKDVVYRLPPGV